VVKSKVGKGNKAIAVIISEDTYEALKLMADVKDWSISQTARNLIEKGLDEFGNQKPQDA
jgi:PHD/YefM family antitoxin component YafN of YafNO toxin-antitoxin module